MQTQTKQLDFAGANVYTGIDTHKNSWKVSIWVDDMYYKTFAQDPNPEVLYKYLLKNFPGASYYTAYEASYCGFWIHDKFTQFGIKSIVVNPSDIPTTDKDRKQKEDLRDSRKIAMGLKNGELSPIYIPKRKTLEDRSLIRLRANLVRDLTRLKNRAKSLLFFYGIPVPIEHEKGAISWTNRYVDWLRTIELKEATGKEALRLIIEQGIHTRKSIYQATVGIKKLAQTPTYSKPFELIRSVPGIGLLSAMTFLTEMEDIKRFPNLNKFYSFVGLVPNTSDSGDKERTGRITSRKSDVLRSIIVECAWSAIRCDPALLRSYQALCKRMKPNRAIIRIAKKLLSRIRFVLISETKYELCKI